MSRILFFGMTGVLSLAPFKALLENEADICGLIVPATGFNQPPLPKQLTAPTPPPSDLPLMTAVINKTILHYAWQANIPVWEVDNLAGTKTQGLFASLAPDVICVACFPYIFPQKLLNLPRYGCLNLHPSRLPAYRGPTPLFWQLQQGERKIGVTLHFLNEGIDSGDIISQATFFLSNGLSGLALEHKCGAIGAQLLSSALHQLTTGKALSRRPQNEGQASYFRAPTVEDFHVSRHWPARRAFNFLRGASDWPLTVDIGPKVVPVKKALGFDMEAVLSTPEIETDGVWRLQFSPGTVDVVI